MNLKELKVSIILCVFIFSFYSCSTVTVKTKDNFEMIELPDGSLVYLNYDSYIRYDKKFSERKIEQNGEAYYFVVHDKNPFVITTPSGEIIVTGTEFDVKSSVDELEVEVDEGTVEVKVKEVIKKIKEGECVIYNKGKDIFEVARAEFKSKIWTNDLKREFKSLGKEFKRSGKEIGKEFKNIKKDIIKATK
jgi:ferric-dicitrate binding protein FerR (iron transport regulator)